MKGYVAVYFTTQVARNISVHWLFSSTTLQYELFWHSMKMLRIKLTYLYSSLTLMQRYFHASTNLVLVLLFAMTKGTLWQPWQPRVQKCFAVRKLNYLHVGKWLSLRWTWDSQNVLLKEITARPCQLFQRWSFISHCWGMWLGIFNIWFEICIG